MNKEVLSRYKTFRKIRDFGQAHAKEFPAGSRGRQCFTEMAQIVAEMEQAATEQETRRVLSRQMAGRKKELRAEMQEVMRAINRTAKAIAIDIPGLDEQFVLPTGNAEDTWLMAARVFAKAAEPLQQEFIDHALPPDFLTRLQTCLSGLGGEPQNSQTSGSTSSGASAQTKELILQGNTILSRLQAIVVNQCSGKKDILAEWVKVSRLDKTGSRSRSTTESATTTDPAPTETADEAAG